MKDNPFNFLVCPKDKHQLRHIEDGLKCVECGVKYSIRNGIPIFFVAENWEERYINDTDYYASENPFPFVNDISYLAFRGNNDYGVTLDLGCGDGVYSSVAPAETQVYCVDVTPTGLNRIFKRGLKNLVPVSASGYELPFVRSCIDTILYVFVVEHLCKGQDLLMLQEARRVLKIGTGRMIYVTDTPFFDKYIVRWTNLFLRWKKTTQDHQSSTGHINLMTMNESRSLLRYAGFEIVSEHPIWMGDRFRVWSMIRKLLNIVLPQALSENYLTSKYVFVVSNPVNMMGMKN